MKERNSNIELLRIVLMIMIICLHYMNGGMGGALKYTLERSINYYLIRFLESLFIIAVNGFVLITGFCMINKKCVNINKIIRLIMEMTIYNIIIYTVFLIIGRADISIKQIIKECVPLVFNNGYWFFKIYICLYMLIPFINSYLIKLEKDKYKKLLLIMFLLFSVWDSIIPNKIITDSGYGIVNFIFLYCIGAYLKLHYKNNIKTRYWFILYLIFGSITFISLFIPVIREYSWAYYFITNILSAISLFNMFNSISINSKLINKIAANTFGVFLLHLNSNILSIEYKIARTDLFWNSNFIVIHMFVVSICIFLVCVILNTVLNKLVNGINNKLISQIRLFNIEIY